MRTGSGSRWHLVFRPDGVAGKWYSSEAASDPSLADEVPGPLRSIPEDPAFVPSETGGVLWWDGSGWQVAAADQEALDEWRQRTGLLRGQAGDYAAWASAYFERAVPESAVVAFLSGATSRQDVAVLAAAWDDITALLEELREMGLAVGL